MEVCLEVQLANSERTFPSKLIALVNEIIVPIILGQESTLHTYLRTVSNFVLFCCFFFVFST